jgi:predicted aspartyl protease
MFPLALALNKNSNSIHYRSQALLDTGFDGFLIINKSIASIMKPKLKGKVAVNIGSNQNIVAPIFDICVVFESLDIDYFVEVEGILLPFEPAPIIGSKLIEQLCNQQNWHLLFNYLDKKVQFIES